MFATPNYIVIIIPNTSAVVKITVLILIQKGEISPLNVRYTKNTIWTVFEDV